MENLLKNIKLILNIKESINNQLIEYAEKKIKKHQLVIDWNSLFIDNGIFYDVCDKNGNIYNIKILKEISDNYEFKHDYRFDNNIIY